MQRIFSSAWALGAVAFLLAQAAFFSSCMSLRHKVDPVSITLNVKLENVDPDTPAASSTDPGSKPPVRPKYGAASP